MAKKSSKEVVEQTEEIKIPKTKLQLAMEVLNKKYGAGSLIGADSIDPDLEVVDTGSLSLNAALDCGGWPLGKLIELQGEESSGKSSATLHAIAGFQKAYPLKQVLLIDYENSFDSKYAEALGVKVSELILSQPNCSEDGYNMAETLIKTGELSLVIIDSHTAGLPKAVVDAEVEKATIALTARVNSIAVGKLKPLLKPYGTTIIAISQLRTSFGVYQTSQKSTGGNAFRFYSDIRVKFSRVVDKEKGLDKTKATVIKNKCGLPFSVAEFQIIWGRGFDRMGEVIKLAVDAGEIIASGSWFTISSDVKVQGLAQVSQFMQDNPEFFKELENKVVKNIKLETVEPDADSVD